MNPLGPARHHSNPSSDSSSSNEPADVALVDSAPGQPLIAVAHHPTDDKDASFPPAPVADAPADDSKPAELAPAEPKKIGTGGRFVVGQKKKISPAGVEGKKGQEEAKKEAGRRVGTGARPGAKGMGVGA